VLVSTAKGVQARARLDIDVHPFRLARAPEGRFAVVYYVQPFDPGNEPYGQAARSQATFGLPRSVARNVEQLYAKLHRQEIAASLDKLRRSGFDTLYAGDWLKDVEQANASLAEPMRFIDLNKANRAAQKRTSPETKREPFVFVDAPGGAAYLYALESCDEKVVRSLREEGLRVFLGYPNTTLPLTDDAGVARFTTGVYLWRLGADGVIAGPARASWGDPYNPFDGYGGERGSLLMPSSAEWPAPNSSRILEEMKEGIVDFRYLATLEKAIAAAGDIPEAKEAGDYLARLRTDISGRLADYVEPSGATFRTRTDTGWTSDRYIRLRRDVTLHLLSLRRALGLAEGAEGAAQDWP
jgi:hypothetical protein